MIKHTKFKKKTYFYLKFTNTLWHIKISRKNSITTKRIKEETMKNLDRIAFSEELKEILNGCASVEIPNTRAELYDMVFGKEEANSFDITYIVHGKEKKEADVVRCRNGAAVNYTEDYMRRRDPECMVIADKKPTNKQKFEETYGYDFSGLRKETLLWLKERELIVVPFRAGGKKYGYPAILICPKNAAFFAYALANLQAFVNIEEEVIPFVPRAIIYVAPPFRHTHFEGKQVCVHNRLDNCHEIFSYNLYPGPSAKKGVYSVLLDIGEQENWVTAHASAARIITPYENEIVIMHEGASGGGKSEMLEAEHRVEDGRILLGTHVVTGGKNYLHLGDTCDIEPISDDMAMCHPAIQGPDGKLGIIDGENGWFLRVDGITEYGSSPAYEKIAIHPKEPLIFFNLQGVAGATCLPWDHTLDSDGNPCPNPRVVIPRYMVDKIVQEPVGVDIRSFGVRMPPATAEHPSYGIMGLMQIIPPALAWLWRLVAPRGHNNPSIIASKGMQSEGVGSYWPFATGLRVRQANLLLQQIISCPNTKYILIPNQHIGVYKVGFAAEWLAREYLARRGGVNVMKRQNLEPARCSLLGYSLREMKIDRQNIRSVFLKCELQEMLGLEGYDKGAKILTDFFAKELKKFDVPELDPLGKEIIACFKRGGTIEDYCNLTPM